MSGSEKKSEQEHVRHFFHKTCNQEVSESFTLQSCKTTKKKSAHFFLCCVQKKVCCTYKSAFLLIRPIVDFFALLVAFADQHYTIMFIFSLSKLYRYYRELRFQPRLNLYIIFFSFFLSFFFFLNGPSRKVMCSLYFYSSQYLIKFYRKVFIFFENRQRKANNNL